MKFADIPGFEDLKSHLTQAIHRGQIAHGQLFAGSTGGAGLMFALAYAQMVNCENPTESDSCDVCLSCIKAAKFVHPDIHFAYPLNKWKGIEDAKKAKEIDPYELLPRFREFLTETPFGTMADWSDLVNFENRTPFIGVPTMRKLMQGLQLKAFEGKYKIQLIWLPETMNQESANAFLKLLEEPPPFTLFILVTEEAEVLLPTIISRTQRVTIPDFTPEDVVKLLVQKFKADSEKAVLAAELCEGSIPAALALLQETGTDLHRFFLDWHRACYQQDYETCLKMAEEFHGLSREMQKSFMLYSLDKLRKALSLGQHAHDAVRLPEPRKSELARLGKILKPALVARFAEELENAYGHLAQSASARMVFFDISRVFSNQYQHFKSHTYA